MKTSIRLFAWSAGLVIFLAGCKDEPEPDPANGGGGNAGLSISSVNPGSGVEGTQVVITGAGFSAALSGNEVRFGTVTAVVDSATATRIVTKVPKDAKTGKVTVSVHGKSASSASDFAVSAISMPAFGTGSSVNTSANVTAGGANVASSIAGKGDAVITQHGHVWSKTNSTPTLADSKSELGKVPDGATFPYRYTTELKNLEANTTYRVRAYFTANNATVYGEVFEVKTSPATEIKVTFDTQQQDVSNITGNSFNIRSFLFAPQPTEVSQYGHVWSSANTTPTVADKKTELGKVTVQNTFVTISSAATGLSGTTAYYVRPYAVINNQTFYGAAWKVTTGEQNNNTVVPVKKADFPGNIDSYRTNSFVKDNKLFVMDAKYTQTGYKYHYKFLQYNPVSNTWTDGFELKEGPSVGSSDVTAYYDKKWYHLSNYATLTEYDMETGKTVSKELKAPGYSSPGSSRFTAVGEKVYIVSSKVLWVLDVKAQTLQKLSDVKIARDVEGIAALNGKLYVLGDGTQNFNETRNALLEYTIASNIWTEKAFADAGNALKYKTYRFRFIEAIGSRIYGFNRWGIGEYDPASNTWKKAFVSDQGDEALEGGVAQVIGSKCYIGLYSNAKKYLLEIAP